MKYFKFTYSLLLVLLLSSVLCAQNGHIEAPDGVIVGDSNLNTDGTIRYDGNDFQGRKAGVWTSLTGGQAPLWSQSGSDIYYDQGYIAIGGDSPEAKLHVKGNYESMRLSGISPWFSLRENGGSTYGFNWMNGGVFKVGVAGSHNMEFMTNGAARMSIADNGDIGIATTSPQAKLHIDTNGEAIRLDGNTPWISFYNGGTYNGYLSHTGTNLDIANLRNGDIWFRTNAMSRMVIANDGNVGIGVFSPNSELHVDGRIQVNNSWLETDGAAGLRISGGIKPITNGSDDLGASIFRFQDVWASNGTIQTSDRKLKKSIKKIKYGLKEVMQLNPVRFKWKDSQEDEYKLGLLAQEVLPVISEVVKTHDYVYSEEKEEMDKVKLDHLGVYYSDLIPVLINAIQDQQGIIEDMKARLDALERNQ